eukprot:GAFH01002026.1.p1 GENE.GAFH01002026.1~~GAFH01002026.1.p1  ORF type:complete len:431 (+),score=67.91 GAFH01002026.1:109-1293(+)
MKDLFDRDQGIGVSFVRIPMGTCDFALDSTTYDDTKDDYSLAHFSVNRDMRYLIPVLQHAQEIRRGYVPPGGALRPLYFMGTPWSPPTWLKTSKAIGYGTLLPTVQARTTLANYFVRFIQAYANVGLPIYAVTIQNEPLFEPRGYGGMHLDASQEVDIAIEMNRAFQQAGLDTKITVYDHNWDNASYPLHILQNAAARNAIAGTAWHCYAGDVAVQIPVHDAYPEKETYLTECSGGAWAPDFDGNLLWDTTVLIIGGMRGWSRAVLKWNLVLDQKDGPTHGGCLNCRGFLTADLSAKPPTLRRESEWYVFGHVAKFVESGARRAESRFAADQPQPDVGALQHVAFVNPREGTAVLVVANPGKNDVAFELAHRSSVAPQVIPARSVMTLVWPLAH